MKKLLIASYWIGILADAAATVALFFPAAAEAAFRPQGVEITPVYLYVSRVAGALMLGWTVLLSWAQRRPVERADILLITIFPVVSVLAVSAIAVAASGRIALANLAPLFVLYAVLFGTCLPAWRWAKTQSTRGTSHEGHQRCVPRR